MGRKQNEWQRERRKRLKELEATGEYNVVGSLLYGYCTDCKRYRILDLDHIDGRGGFDPHRMENLDPVCRICHLIRHGTIMSKSDKKKKSKKSKWEMPHNCKNCKAIVSTLLCTECQKMSI